MTKPRQRRPGTIPRHTYWSPQAVALIDAYQAQHQLPSFSAAAEALVRLGLEQSPTEVITPIVMSAIHKAVHQALERLIRLQIYTAVEAGIVQRFAAAAVRDIGRLKQDDPQRYDRIKAAAIADTRRRLARTNIDQVLQELYGDRKGELHHTGQDGAEGSEGRAAGGEVLHLS